MKLTVGQLKKMMASIPDDYILADLGFGNQAFRPYTQVKRLIVVERVATKEHFLAINGQGSHFHGMGEQSGYRIIDFLEEKPEQL